MKCRVETSLVKRRGGDSLFLNSVRVVDFTMLLPGPYASLRLADLGAEVVKVEPPGGDPARHTKQAVSGQGVVFVANNRNKRSVEIDLKSREGQAEALQLVRTADVVLEGFRPGVAARLGIGYEAVRQVNPRVIYCSLTGYGQDGPYANLAGHDLNYLAASGMLSLFPDGSGHPVVPRVQLADLIGGVMAAEAVVAALFKRDRTGQGERLDVSMTESVMGLLNTHAVIEKETGYTQGIAELGGSLVCYNLYQTQDGRTVSLGALEPKFWRNFCEAVSRPEWMAFQMASASMDNPVYREMTALFAEHDFRWWAEFAGRVDCCLQPVLSVGEAMNSEYARARGVVADAASVVAAVGIRQVHTHAGGHRPR